MGDNSDRTGWSIYRIKSFKHNGHIHRIWLENWLVPEHMVSPEHRHEGMIILVNSQTKIIESNGHEWTSKVPGVTVFIPGEWYNIVALIEEQGIRYYCNVASPPYKTKGTITYIDYDLDVVVSAEPKREAIVVDREEYEQHKLKYRYSRIVEEKVQQGLQSLLKRVKQHGAPFNDRSMTSYYEMWRNAF